MPETGEREQINVRLGLDDRWIVARLKEKAKARGKSTNAFVVETLARAAKDDPTDGSVDRVAELEARVQKLEALVDRLARCFD